MLNNEKNKSNHQFGLLFDYRCIESSSIEQTEPARRPQLQPYTSTFPFHPRRSSPAYKLIITY